VLDRAFIRANVELVRQAIADRHDDAPLDRFLEADSRLREVIRQDESLRARRNELGRLNADASQRTAETIAEGRQVGEEVKRLAAERAALEAEVEELILRIPNIPAPGVPVGPDESANELLREWGEPQAFAFQAKPHWELGEALGSRFYHLRGAGARLQRGMIAWLLDRHGAAGYLEVYPPYLVRSQVMVQSGQLPKFADNLFHDAEEDLWMIPTAEVVLVALHSGETLPAERLPLNYTAYTACFRREKMSAGRDVRGIKRGFQFDKVELVKVVEPSSSDAELESMVRHATGLLEQLGLAYRVVQLCTGDLGFAMRKTFDLEVWAPGVGEWLEVSSCSNAGDYQARRAALRYQPADGRPRLAHTLNGSGFGMPRMLIAVLENYQQADGSIVVPEVLRRYVGVDVIR
jgi:seryl-tRNA synthetase